MRRLIIGVLAIVLLAGMVMIPGGAASAQDDSGTECTQTHTVASGQNLYRIGLLYGISWVDLQQWNNLANPNLIYVGQVLCVSGPAAPGSGSDGGDDTPGTSGPVVISPGNPFGPTAEPRIYFPTIALGQQFELFGYNFPANTQVTIGMKVLGGPAYTPYYTATTDASGEFYVLIDIPTALENASTVAVEARTAGGYFGLNWFYNY